ncbi:hypothetical protein PHSY_002458 [Pseudozyma hubeiensis SY62]|uniref:Uncharacterized protein n=1 Tax=Pseudozyma hubeiensis (strain SY62) TaxID=1305764 RepID=R9P9Z7_PSEHS|nr:hypothetical protein PHSY_002458 [Pseudozyma hubeiensis SY62]GAC94885.1 hypothetical protein PHSY_002458 [Pseudozyma hubeiensis SY62]
MSRKDETDRSGRSDRIGDNIDPIDEPCFRLVWEFLPDRVDRSCSKNSCSKDVAIRVLRHILSLSHHLQSFDTSSQRASSTIVRFASLCPRFGSTWPPPSPVHWDEVSRLQTKPSNRKCGPFATNPLSLSLRQIERNTASPVGFQTRHFLSQRMTSIPIISELSVILRDVLGSEEQEYFF